MSIYFKFALFQCAIIIPFLAGIAARSRVRSTQEISRRLVRLNIIGLEPLIVLWCTWGLALSAGLMILPLFGFGLIVIGLLAGSRAASLLRLRGTRRKTFLITSSLANHGFTMGGFLCYFFLGEHGLGLSVILVLYFIPYVYCLVFPYARADAGRPVGFTGFFKKMLTDLQNMPLFAMTAGLVLNAAGIKRPAVAFPLEALLLISVSLYYLTLGISFTRVNLRGIRLELAALSVIKFAVVPAAAWALLSLLPIDPALKAVVQLQAFMPAAIYSMVTAVLFDLDTELASGLFVCNTVVFLAAVLPALFLFKDVLF